MLHQTAPPHCVDVSFVVAPLLVVVVCGSQHFGGM